MTDKLIGHTIFRNYDSTVDDSPYQYRYSDQVLDDLLEHASKHEILGCIGMYDFVNGNTNAPTLANVSHKIENLRRSESGNELLGDIRIFDTPMGQKLKELVELEDYQNHMYLAAAGIGKTSTVDGTPIVRDYTLIAVNVCQKLEIQQEETQ